MKGVSFLLRCLAEIPSRMVQVLHRGMLPQHLRFAIKHKQPGRNPGQCFALKCGHFSVGVFGICFQTIQYCHNPSNRQVGTWRRRWIPISIQISTCKTLFFRCGCGFTSGRESSCTEFASLRYCNPGQVGAIATASERVLDLDTIAIHRIFCVGSGRCSMSPSRRSSNCEINMFGWSALESK